MFKFESKLCRGIKPYTAGEQPKDCNYIKLNTNENPYPPPPSVNEVIKNLDYKRLRLYPDNNCADLINALAETENVSAENVFAGNGSDEVLALCFPAFFDSEIVFADITYSFYKVFADLFKIKYRLIPLNDDFTININDYFNIKEQAIIIANPNAPTGIALQPEQIKSILDKNPDKLVIIDEAYVDFFGKSCVCLTKTYDNLLVVKTFSKSYSLAGIRCGYAVGNKELITALNKIKDSFNSYPLDAVCQKVCVAALGDAEYHNEVISKIVKTREKFTAELKNIGFEVLPSDANFVFAKHKPPRPCGAPLERGMGGKDLYLKLKDNKILVRHFDKPRITGFVRITIGTDAEMGELINKLIIDNR